MVRDHDGVVFRRPSSPIASVPEAPDIIEVDPQTPLARNASPKFTLQTGGCFDHINDAILSASDGLLLQDADQLKVRESAMPEVWGFQILC